MTAMSRNQDIELRGWWQKRQIEHYCQKYGLDELRDSLPADPDTLPTDTPAAESKREAHYRQKLFRHMIFDDERSVLFCFIPKVCSDLLI